MVFYAAFNSISVISRRQLTLFMISWVSPVLGWALKSLPRTLPRKNPEDPVRLEPRTPGLQVKHLTTEPRGTLHSYLKGFGDNKLFRRSLVRSSAGPMLFPRVDDSHCDRIHTSLTAVCCLENGYVWKAASGLERIMCVVLVKRSPGKHG